MAPGNFMANTPLEFLVSGSEIGLETLYLMPGEPLPQSLPPHDVLFVAIGESASAQDLLAELGSAVDGWNSPLLNHPLHSLCLARDTVSLILNGEAGISMPLTARLARRSAGHRRWRRHHRLAGRRPMAADRAPGRFACRQGVAADRRQRGPGPIPGRP
jgi:hypothetical protein